MAHELALGVELPPLLLDDQDFTSFVYPETVPNFVGGAAVTGPVFWMERPGARPDELAGKIVLIMQADPGYDWLFAHRIAAFCFGHW